jgi:hypothetical protein
MFGSVGGLADVERRELARSGHALRCKLDDVDVELSRASRLRFSGFGQSDWSSIRLSAQATQSPPEPLVVVTFPSRPDLTMVRVRFGDELDVVRWNSWTRVSPVQFGGEEKPKLRAVRLCCAAARPADSVQIIEGEKVVNGTILAVANSILH